jgi:hypothetical protein
MKITVEYPTPNLFEALIEDISNQKAKYADAPEDSYFGRSYKICDETLKLLLAAREAYQQKV